MRSPLHARSTKCTERLSARNPYGYHRAVPVSVTGQPGTGFIADERGRRSKLPDATDPSLGEFRTARQVRTKIVVCAVAFVVVVAGAARLWITAVPAASGVVRGESVRIMIVAMGAKTRVAPFDRLRMEHRRHGAAAPRGG